MTIYLDNAATSFPKPECVKRAVSETVENIGGNPGRGSHSLSLSAYRLIFGARERVARLFNIKDSRRVIFTANATEALNLALKGFLSEGDHVITSSVEHNSVVRPLKSLMLKGVEVTKIPCSSEGELDSLDIKKAVKNNTKLVALAHASNVIGTIMPLKDVGRICKEMGVRLLVDAAQTAGILSIDVNELNIDLLACSGHKGLLGIQGTGILYVGEGIKLRCIKEGGTGSFSEEDIQPDILPDRFESGTLNTPGIASIKAGVEFLDKEGLDKIRAHEADLIGHLVAGLSKNEEVILYGTEDFNRRIGILPLNIKGIDQAEIGERLDKDFGIMVRTGLHCSPDSHRTLGTFPKGTVRISPGYFNAKEEIELTIVAINQIITEKRKKK